MKAGISRRDITPPDGTPIAGNVRLRPTKATHDPLWAKALYLEDRATRAVLIVVDLCLLPLDFATEARRRVSEAAGVPLTAVVLCCTHSHSGPGVGSWAPWDGREAYEHALMAAIVDAARDAAHHTFEARFACADASRPDLCHNRRFVRPDAKVDTGTRPRIAYTGPDGPVDPVLHALRVEQADGRPRALLSVFACHPTSLAGTEDVISANYPFWIEQEVKAALGSDVESLFFCGALGDVCEAGSPQERRRLVGYPLAERIGGEAGREVVRALRERPTPLDPGLQTGWADVSLPTIDMGPERRRASERILASPSGHESWAVRDAEMILDMASDWPEEIRTGVPLVAIGGCAFYGMPGELFCWYGMELKARSRFAHPVVLGLANDRIGYIADRVFPTKDIFDQPLDFHRRDFAAHDDAGVRLVRAALTL